MSKKIPKVVDFTFSETPSLMDVSLIESELNNIADARPAQVPEGLPDAVSAGLVPDEVDLQIEEKEEIQEEDIFDMEPTKTAKKIKKDKQLEVLEEELEQSISKPVKHKRKRKPMSAEHLAKLALAREKAQIARKAKKEEREEALKLEKEQKDLLKKVKQKRVSKLKKEVEQSDSEGEEEEEVKTKGKGKSLGLTQADLEEAQYQAILKYDSMRKAQKEEKRKKQMIEQEKQKMLATINRATGQTYSYGARRSDGRLMNRFDNCY